MFHTKTEYRCGIIIANLLLFSVEANALGNVAITVETGDAEWHFETDSLGIAVETWRLLFVQFITRDNTLVFGWDISTEYIELVQGKMKRRVGLTPC